MPALDLLPRLLASIPLFLLAITLHEVGHAYAAYLLGDDTAKQAGRLTLNPIAHLDPVGSVLFLVSVFSGFGFGWAKPVPVSPWRLRHPRRDRALLTLAGPVANLVQAVAWSLLYRAVSAYPVLPAAPALAILCLLGTLINVWLFVFNLLPIPPLDGSHLAAWLLQVRDPGVVDRLAPVGFLALLVFINTSVFDIVFDKLASPLMALLLPGI